MGKGGRSARKVVQFDVRANASNIINNDCDNLVSATGHWNIKTVEKL